MRRQTKILTGVILVFALATFAALKTYFSLQSKIAQRLEMGYVIPPLEIYSQGFALSVGRHLPLPEIENELGRRQLARDRDFRIALGIEACAALVPSKLGAVKLKDESQNCLWLRESENGSLFLTWDNLGLVQEIWSGDGWQSVTSFALFPKLITQFFDGQPILQQNTPLSEVPLVCLQAVTAIEDRDFLEHGGVSVTGIFRAMLRNLRAGRFAEGGSTITQQLVKNFFLNSKKTLRRKIEEQLLAVMLESQLSKDQIFEMYLNVIYMGQTGPYQVRGFASAASYYFDRPLAQLKLSDCALLAALINNPGRYSPFTHAPAAQARRELVLRKMQEAQMIGASEVTDATRGSLPSLPAAERRAHAPYFVMGALKEFAALGLEAEEGARLYTTLDPEIQSLTTAAVELQLPKIEAKIKRRAAAPLQVAVVTVDLNTAQILSLVGGRDYRTTQFNRATDSRRQIGSIIKPFVYWTALKTHDALTAVSDEAFTWKSGKQIWKPKNFEPGSLGSVPYFFALAHSLNIPAARVGQEVGLDQVAKTLRAAGIEESIPDLPSLTLGALELSPLEVAQAYSTLARLGDGDRVHTLLRIEDLKRNVLYSHDPELDYKLEAAPTAVLVGMMEQSFTLGTARAASLAGLTGALAGKTGTTSDTKDAWFGGFSPRILTVVWVGYDDNTVLGLTGAGAALPIWIEATRGSQKLFGAQDFRWPPEVEVRQITRDSLNQSFPNLKALPESVSLVFKR